MPGRPGEALFQIGSIVVKAILDAAGQVLFDVTSYGSVPFRVSFRETGQPIDTGSIDVDRESTKEFNAMGALRAGAEVTVSYRVEL